MANRYLSDFNRRWKGARSAFFPSLWLRSNASGFTPELFITHVPKGP